MSSMNGLSLAILGTRGIPARYGGFETFADQLAQRLARRGHQVTVYGRDRYAAPGRQGVESIVLPSIYSKHLETPTHTFLSVLHCGVRSPDVALICNTANACFLPLLRAAGIPTVMNTDGIEWQRRKWGVAGRTVHMFSEHLAAAWADVLIADAGFIAEYYRQYHGRETVRIPYGGDLPRPESTSVLDSLGLKPGAYDLCVCRFEPENRPLTVVRAHCGLKEPIPLVMVGGAPYATAYRRRLEAEADASTLFTGYRFGDEYRQLLFNSRALLYAGEVGGTHPVLLEAMGAGRLVIYHDTPENRETVGDAGLPFGPGGEDSLRSVWQQIADHPEWPQKYGARARARVQRHYLWEDVTDSYEQVFRSLARTP
jgi:glycosyltransferase involved in cell wall biosynthesis